MDESYDIFRRVDGRLVWVGAAERVARQGERVVQDPCAIDCEFLVVNALTGERTLIEPPDRLAVESLA